MIRSMTGFGRGEASVPGGNLRIEIKTLNHRFLELSSKLPDKFSIFEDKIRSELALHIKRGKVNLFLTYEGTDNLKPYFAIDLDLAKKYVRLLTELKNSLRLKDDVTLSQIISFPNIITTQEPLKDEAHLWPSLKMALAAALKDLIKTREKEGRSLSKDILERKRSILKALSLIERRSSIAVKEYRAKLLKRIAELSAGRIKLDEGRLEFEVALFAKNSDTTEEITRLKTHLNGFEDTLRCNNEVGRKLDFITQELHREINTIGQKTSDCKTSQAAIEIKGHIEKIREQVQNIE